jgi:DnaK suppressor protein
MRRSELIKQMRPLLLKRRQALLRALNNDFASTLSVDDNDVRDIADRAVETEYREVIAELAEVESRELKQIDEALQRLTKGEYGVCVECEKNIPMARLQALPYATKCIHCQQPKFPNMRPEDLPLANTLLTNVVL